MSLIVVGEGHGEGNALPGLVHRLRNHLGLTEPLYVPQNRTWRHGLITRAQVMNVCEQVRAVGPRGLLLTRDADNDHLPQADCPKWSAPEIAQWVRELQLPFPAAVVLFYKEYETLFLAGAGAMAGCDVLDERNRVIAKIPDIESHPSPEFPRDAKGWVAQKILQGYKPTLFQNSLTQLLDFTAIGDPQLSSFRRLVSALQFLDQNVEVQGAVYPAAPPGRVP